MNRLCAVFLLLVAAGCSEPDVATRTQCRDAPMTEGVRAAREELATLIRDAQSQGRGSVYEVVEGIDPNNLRFLGRTDTEPGDLMTFDFRAANNIGPTFSVLVGDGCAAEVNWR
jgi:hypothetical protein